MAREEAEVGVVEEGEVADLVRDLPGGGVVGRGLARVEDRELVVLFVLFWGLMGFGLFGVGGNLGPDLTGSQRMNLEYLLENIMEPNATVAADYRMSAVALKDGRLLTGLVFKRSNGVVEVAGPTERKTVPQDEIESIKPLNVSPMPENLLESMGKKDILNLFGYLMSPVQVNAAQ